MPSEEIEGLEMTVNEAMYNMGNALDQILNGITRQRKYGFVLMVFPITDLELEPMYISNCKNRDDIIVLLDRQIARLRDEQLKEELNNEEKTK